jgi:uncharacterized protein
MSSPARLTGRMFTHVVRTGALAVSREQEVLNRINVFPVRDADTGYNLAATLRAAAAKLGDDAPEEVGAATRLAADAALVGARGNSGAIMAQFLHGLAIAASGAVALSTAEFAAAAANGVDAAYAALAEPREGTILSVLRAWARALRQHAPSVTEFPDLLSRGLEGARAALADTPRQLEVLARNHVVDAGGQGFVFFLEGASASFQEGGLAVLATAASAASAAVAAEAKVPGDRSLPAGAGHDPDDRFRFCTETLVSAESHGIDRTALTRALMKLGGSLVVAGGGTQLRVHVHTNEPRLALQKIAGFGRLEGTKVDDMLLQQTGARTADIAIVTDSTCELPERRLFDLGVVTVPLTLAFGDDSYLDGVDMTLDGFMQRMAQSRTSPVSSQPPVADFRDIYTHLLAYRRGIVSIHIAAAQSGTWQSACVAAREVDGERIRVIDSCTNSVGAGLLIEAVGEALERGTSLEELERLALDVRHKITIFGAVQDLGSAVRGGRVRSRAADLVDRLHLKPTIVFDQVGHARLGGVSLGFRRAMDTLAQRVERFAAGAPVRLMITHTDAPEWVEELRARLRERVGADSVPAVRSGPVLTSHVGLGSVSIAVRRLDD